MKDEEVKFEEIESSHTLRGTGEVVRGEGRGDRVDDTVTLMSSTLRYMNLTEVGIIYQVLLR